MADEEGFLDRWSKRKRAARAAEAVPEVEPERQPDPEPIAAATDDDEPEIDPAELPSLDSITSGADVQAFLQKGVPKALRQAALRRLWSADPGIREFREVADYDWDFNAPGYGALLPGDDPKAAAEKLFADLRRQVTTRDAPPAAAPVARQQAPATDEAGETPAPTETPRTTPAAAAEPEAPARAPAPTAAGPAPRRRRHGSAVPS